MYIYIYIYIYIFIYLFIHVSVSYKRITSQFSKLLLCLQFLKNNQPKIIFMPINIF